MNSIFKFLALFAMIVFTSACGAMYPGLNSVRTSVDSMSGTQYAETTLVTRPANNPFAAYNMIVHATKTESMTGTYLTPTLSDNSACHSDQLEISISGNYGILDSNDIPSFNASSTSMSTTRRFALTSNYTINYSDTVNLRWCGREFTMTPGSVGRLADLHATNL